MERGHTRVFCKGSNNKEDTPPPACPSVAPGCEARSEGGLALGGCGEGVGGVRKLCGFKTVTNSMPFRLKECHMFSILLPSAVMIVIRKTARRQLSS